MQPIRSTYRVQLGPDFGFGHLTSLAGYLSALGVTHVYLSPSFRAAPGSTHGYDVVDPTSFSGELGGEVGFTAAAAALRSHGIGLVLDIVPNHMATDPSNRWWWDVLENGPTARHGHHFDIDWHAGGGAPGVLVPVLGDQYGRVLEAGEFGLRRDGGSFTLTYHDHRFPIAPATYDQILAPAARRAGAVDLAALAERCRRVSSPSRIEERRRATSEIRSELQRLYSADPGVCEAVDTELHLIAGDPDRLDRLVGSQHYRLAHWVTATDELDYRRFFNIQSLIGVRAEDPAVFADLHQLALDLVAEGTVDALRIDHIDGLRDPARYLSRLAAASPRTPVFVEKILHHRERLPARWPVTGTTGYEFLNGVNQLFIDRSSEKQLTELYGDVTGERRDFAEVARDCKRLIMRTELRIEVDTVTRLLAEICDADRRHRDHTRRALREAVEELVAAFPVYRTYLTPGEHSPEDLAVVDTAVECLRARPIDAELVALIGDVLAGRRVGDAEAEFTARFQQLTPPVTAKGVEDTAFYRYNRFISLNEVGGDPGRFGGEGLALDGRSMLTLSTHDTKRSADVRARLNVISETPGPWGELVERFMPLTEPVDPNTAYFLLQTAIGAWPITTDRLIAAMLKSVREARTHTSWSRPDETYEAEVSRLAERCVADPEVSGLLARFVADTALIARGRANSLAQTTIALTCPGVTDVYQGSEVWDLSLVDPDNRRPVDHGRLSILLAESVEAPVRAGDDSGMSKLKLTAELLRRRQAVTTHEPLGVTGPRSDDVLAYRTGDMAVVVRLRTAGDWTGTSVELPTGDWRSVLDGEGGLSGRIDAGRSSWPVTVLERSNHSW